MKEGVTTTMKRRKRGGAGRTPHGWLPPLSYIYVGHAPLLTHLVASIPYLVALHHGCCLSEALPKLLATNTWRSGGGGVPADPYFRCLAGLRVWRSSSNRTCIRVRGRCHLWRRVHNLMIVKWTTMSTTSSERLRRLRASSSTLHRQRLCGNVISATGLRGLVYRCYHLVEFSWLVYVFMRRNFFVFLCYKPISGIRAISMRSWYARLEHMWMWALMIMLLQFFVFWIIVA
jgi:hypothetical protein